MPSSTAHSISCPTLLISGPASGQGKTTVTVALARHLARQGWRVRIFKCGADFLDPVWHGLASGYPSDNLDLWINGEDDIHARLEGAARNCDVILIEGVMGLFDGKPDSAELALRFGLPVLTVIDASAMAGTFGAVAHGLRHYRPGLRWAGVLANRVAGDGHTQMLREAVRADEGDGVATLRTDIESGWLGALEARVDFALPERHLGLTLTSEIPDAVKRLEAMADALAATPLGRMRIDDWQRWAVRFSQPMQPSTSALLSGRRIAVARDAAFCFIYQANLEVLHSLGAATVFFSPLADDPLPACDAVWLPGGYPELHAATLTASRYCCASLREHVAANRPVWAECGGMMPLFDSLVDADGMRHPMWGLLPGEVCLESRLVALGPQRWKTRHGQLRGHTFHFSSVRTLARTIGHTETSDGGRCGEAVFASRYLRASYFHAWFASSEAATAALFLPDPV